jgi:hypothetical protein
VSVFGASCFAHAVKAAAAAAAAVMTIIRRVCILPPSLLKTGSGPSFVVRLAGRSRLEKYYGRPE